MNCCLEHFLLMVDLAQELPCKFAGIWVSFEPTAVGLDFEELFGWDLHLKPLTKFHLF
jgi:hypothetical protein